MPDILILGMELPKKDGLLSINIWPNGSVTIAMDLECKPVARAVELPEHGDLIDRDALLAEYERDERAADEHGREFSFSFDSVGARCTEWWIVQQKLMDAPVVIPAERREG